MKRDYMIANSSDRVDEQLKKAKKSRKQVLDGIKAQIISNNEFIKSNTRKKQAIKPKKSQQQQKVLKVNKQKSMGHLSKNINERIKFDKQVKGKLRQFNVQQLDRQVKLQKRIQQVKRRNQLRIKQIDQYQRRYIKKINQDYSKDKEKQQKLLQQYQRVLQKQGKLKFAKQYRQQAQVQDWKHILEQKRKLTKMIQQYKNKQIKLLKQRDQQPQKKPQQNKNQQKKPQVQIPQIKQGDNAKDIGNAYLQFAKSKKAQPVKPKRVLMDIKLKSIDYSKQILKNISRNQGDLSKLPPPTQNQRTSSQMTGTVINTITNAFNIQNKQKQQQKQQLDPVLQFKQDQQTKKHLQSIKANLQQLQKQ